MSSSFLASKKLTTALTRTFTYTTLVIGAFFLMIPFVWMVSTSLKEPGDVLKFPPEWIPDPFVWTNFREAVTLPYAPMTSVV